VGNSQRGLSLFGALVLLAIVAAAGYYLYHAVIEGEDDPGCNNTRLNCMKHCRRATTEAPAAQACQERCQRDYDECSRQQR